MAEHPIQGLMGVTIEKIRDMVNSETTKVMNTLLLLDQPKRRRARSAR